MGRPRRASVGAVLAAALGLWAGVWAGAASAGPCAPWSFEDRGHVLCTVEAGADLRLWLRDAEGRVWGGFQRLAGTLAERGERLVFAMNAGMYHADRAPVGLFRGEGGVEGRLVTAAGPGNFGMLPNGVFCVLDGSFAVVESRRFAAAPPDCRAASQSGPMLVIDGALHPRFLPDSSSRFLRNGVGVSPDGRRAHFLISEGAVSFDEFARAFRDGLGVEQALYFDGNVSRLFAPALGRNDTGRRLGPIVGLVVPAAD